jgi:hypothetical protein
MEEQIKAKTKARGSAPEILSVWLQIQENVAPGERFDFVTKEGVEESGILVSVNDKNLVVKLLGSDEEKSFSVETIASHSKPIFTKKVV